MYFILLKSKKFTLKGTVGTSAILTPGGFKFLL